MGIVSETQREIIIIPYNNMGRTTANRRQGMETESIWWGGYGIVSLLPCNFVNQY